MAVKPGRGLVCYGGDHTGGILPPSFIRYCYCGGTCDGGAAAVITTGPADHPTPIVTLRQRGRKITSSYEEEKDAMLMTVEWIVQNSPQGKTVICSVLTVSPC